MAFHQPPLPTFSIPAVNVYMAEQVRELDRLAIQEQGIAGISLMKRAGQALFDRIFSDWPSTGHLTVFCGPGNNGGDGYVVAALAAREKMPVMLV
ncbi:MAG: NAD(P)H-hydrate epimerase, partial [Pseudomonadales bacterium]